jgi:crossover junction endodeoxyribonuclease RuvC
MKKNRVLAIDPGYERVGIAIIEKNNQRKEELLFSECFKTTTDTSFAIRLKKIGLEVTRIIEKYEPKVLAIEKLYLSVNQKTAMGVAEARGVIVYSASLSNLEIFEYTPPEIKLAVTGYGKADKKMVMGMVAKLIKIEKKTTSDDELDAIAIGLTFLACQKIK